MLPILSSVCENKFERIKIEIMKSILHELYNGKIYPAERIVSKDPEYHPLNKKIEEEKELLKKRLSEDDIKKILQLEDMYTLSASMEERQSFIYGFKLGSLLMLEVFAGEDEIIFR